MAQNPESAYNTVRSPELSKGSPDIKQLIADRYVAFKNSISERRSDVKNGLKKATATVVIGSGALFLNACATESEPQENPGVEVVVEEVEELEPTPEPTVESPESNESPYANEPWYEEEMSAIELGPIPEDLIKYRDMDFIEFSELPKPEQWKYVSWLTQNRDTFMEVYYKYSGSVEANKPITLGPESTAADVISFSNTTHRQSLVVVEGGIPDPQPSGPSGVLDKDALGKITIADYTEKLDADESFGRKWNAVGDNAPSIRMIGGKVFESSDWVITNEQVVDEEYDGVAAKKHIIDYIDSASVKRQITAYVYPITTFDNKTMYVASMTPGVTTE